MAHPTPIRALTGVRAVAAAMVFFFHATPALLRDDAFSFRLRSFWPVQYGWTGVNLFFALSGFLFVRLYAPLTSEHFFETRGEVTRFWRKRLVRIMPLYLLVLLLAFAVSASSLPDLIAHAFLVHNYLARFRFSIGSPFWSLAVEAHFYLLFPLVVMLLPRSENQTRSLWLRVLFMVLLSLAARELARISADVKMAYTGRYDSNLWPTSIAGRFSDFAFGMVAAWAALWFEQNGESNRLFTYVAGILGVALLVQSCLFIEQNGGLAHASTLRPFWIFGVLFAGGFAALLPWVTHSKVADRMLGNRFVVALGESSYGLYLVQALLIDHLSLVARTQLLLRSHVPYAATCALLLSYGIAAGFAHILHLIWEKPVQRWLSKR